MVAAEGVSELSVHEEQPRRVQIDRRRTNRIKNLMESAKDGNELSQRIWETVRTINEDPS